MTTAPPAQQVRLLEIAAVDTELRQVAYQRRSLPEHEELKSLGATSAGVQASRAAVGVRVADLERAVRKAEADVEQVRNRASRDTDRLNAGTGSAKDLVGLQHELESLGRRQSELEDIELELMEQLEAAQGEAAELAAQADQLAVATTEAAQRRDGALAELADREADLVDRRGELAGAVIGELLALYDRIAARSGGVAAARLVGNRCGACRVEFPAVDLATIRRAGPQEVIQCDECQAILIHDRADDQTAH